MATIVIDHRVPNAAPTATPSRLQKDPRDIKQAPVRPTITVNGTVIAHAAIAREVQNHPAESPAEAWTAASRALIIRELLIQQASRLGIQASQGEVHQGRRETDEEALIRTLLEQELSIPEADEMSCRRYYDKNPNLFRSADLFEAAHILISADRSDAAAFDRAADSAKTALKLLLARPNCFAELAQELSACSSSRNGGHLGQFTREQVTPEFAAALDQLQPEEITSSPVETRYGVHIIRLDKRVEGRRLPFESVRERIAAYLTASVWYRAAAQYISLLAGQATITGFDFDGADTPLVQ